MSLLYLHGPKTFQVNRKIQSALISVYHKDGIENIARLMHANNVVIYSTGGTQSFLEDKGIPVVAVETITDYPSILDGRVKTLHPKVFGGILSRRDDATHQQEVESYQIPFIDCVVVDLYPFEKTAASGASEADIIEKIDIGGISLIRGAAKNFNDVVVVPSVDFYPQLHEILESQHGVSSLEQRKHLAQKAFAVSSHYDTAIASWFAGSGNQSLIITEHTFKTLRYGENPHQKGQFYGRQEEVFDQLNGKELSYNNLLDVDAAVQLITEFETSEPTFAILKHNNACGVASRNSASEAYDAALAGDPISAFGGVIISNCPIDIATAEKINTLFCEVVIAPKFDDGALAILSSKPNRIILRLKSFRFPERTVRTLLNGYLTQDRDARTENVNDLQVVTETLSSEERLTDLVFAQKIAKHTRSNTIVLAKNKQLLGSGTGQTSRVDALKQAIEKANNFQFDLNDAVMASDAFFPFPDCVEIAYSVGIRHVIQPGGSIKDQLSVDYCNKMKMAMYFTGVRHFRH